MPTENDWILNGLAYDPSYMRDFLSYKLSNLIGNYASRGKYCELVLNGEFRGIYVLQEKLKADDSRIDIKKIKDDDLTLPKLTGGYITKTDKIEGSDTVAWGMDNYGGWQSNFVHEHPKSSEVMPEQHSYIENEFLTIQSYVNNPSNSSIIEGYPSIIDVPSFIDFIILNEISSNADGYEFSTFFHKDRNDKLRAGPIWDFNLTFGNDLFQWGYDRSKPDLWQFLNGNMGTMFWTDLFNDPVFKCYLTKRWQELIAPGNPMNSYGISQLIDATKTLIMEAATRQELLSGTTGQFEDQMSALKSFIFERISWISGQLSDTSLCDNVPTPPLVISKINYHPLVQEDQDSSDYEFIEIINNSRSSVNLTGIYFGGLGLTYQFSPGATISGNKSIYLANKSESFKERYGFEPFGEFSRSLSNDGEDLVLLDAYGNIIDEVTYNDALPWPEEADGDGSLLQLKSLGLDNSLASNWKAVTDIAGNLSTNFVQIEPYVTLGPNPVSDLLTLEISSGEISDVKLFSLDGKLVRSYAFNQRKVELDVSTFENGLYLLQIQTNTSILHKKILKN